MPTGIKLWTLKRPRSNEDLQVNVFQPNSDEASHLLFIEIWGCDDDFGRVRPKAARWLAAVLVKAATFVEQAKGRRFKGYRLHGTDEDGKSITFDAKTPQMVRETKRHWRIAGGTTHRVTRVYAKVVR